MALVLTPALLAQIQADGERSYPAEGAGLLLGRVAGDQKLIQALLPLANAREEAARHNRYLLTAEDYLHGELEAARLGMEVLGVFHSHPDHPNRPSEFDREWAIPWFSYLITSVEQGKAVQSKSWALLEDRSAFVEEPLLIGLPEN